MKGATGGVMVKALNSRSEGCEFKPLISAWQSLKFKLKINSIRVYSALPIINEEVIITAS